jgi:4-amino-4-deoxy-L-arabinose transferase-like glycosyltransferase
VLIALVVIPALCLWTGYGLLQLIGPKTLRLDVPGGLFLFGLAGVLTLGWIAFVAAELGFFSAVAIAVLGVLLGLSGWLVGRRRGPRVSLDRTGSRRAENILLIGLIALMGVLYLRPHEFIFGGADAGVYVNLGAQISRSGRWLISNPDLAAIPPADYPMLFREQPPDQVPRYYHLPGFYIADGNAGTIIPQFYPLHPIWLAIAHGLGGVWANLYMTPLWGILGVLALYIAVREAFDHRLAAIAAGLLAITPTQIWFSRYPTAETLTQFMLFSGLYAFARHARRGENWSAALAGLALGQVMLVRIDTYFLLGILVVYAAYLRLRRRLDRRFWILAVPMLVMSSHSLLQAVWQGWPYLHNTYLAGGTLSFARLAMLVGGLIVSVVAFIAFDQTIARRPGWVAQLEPVWRILLSASAVGLVLLAIYAYFLLPLRADPTRQAFYWYGQNTIPDVEPYNFVRLGWYLSPVGLALGVLGIAAIVREKMSERTWLIVGVGVFFSILFIYRTFNNPHHIYVMRRYVPAVIPIFALGIAYAVQRLAQWKSIGRIFAGGLAVLQVGLLLYAGRVIIRQVDYRGGIGQFGSFSKAIPPGAIVVFNDNQPVGTAGIYGTPLAYLEGHTVIGLQGDRIDRVQLDALVNGWLAAQRPVVIVDGPSRVAGLCDRWECSHLGTARFDMPVLEPSYEHFPTAILRMQDALELYLVKAVQPQAGRHRYQCPTCQKTLGGCLG